MKGRVALLELVDFCLSRQEKTGSEICLRWPADPVGLVLAVEHLLLQRSPPVNNVFLLVGLLLLVDYVSCHSPHQSAYIYNKGASNRQPS